MSFGLKNAPATFQQTMEIVLRGLEGKICFVYLDDISIFGQTMEEHLERLEKILERLATVGLKIKLNKCSFLQSQLKYLGHIVTSEGIKPNLEKIDTIQNYPVPKTKRSSWIHWIIGVLP